MNKAEKILAVSDSAQKVLDLYNALKLTSPRVNKILENLMPIVVDNKTFFMENHLEYRAGGAEVIVFTSWAALNAVVCKMVESNPQKYPIWSFDQGLAFYQGHEGEIFRVSEGDKKTGRVKLEKMEKILGSKRRTFKFSHEATLDEFLSLQPVSYQEFSND